MRVISGYLMIFISTHSLTRRLTAVFEADLQAMDISTHSLTRRLTSVFQKFICDPDISTHSLTRRLTGAVRKSYWWRFYFNSQPHKEADHRPPR